MLFLRRGPQRRPQRPGALRSFFNTSITWQEASGHQGTHREEHPAAVLERPSLHVQVIYGARGLRQSALLHKCGLNMHTAVTPQASGHHQIPLSPCPVLLSPSLPPGCCIDRLKTGTMSVSAPYTVHLECEFQRVVMGDFGLAHRTERQWRRHNMDEPPAGKHRDG